MILGSHNSWSYLKPKKWWMRLFGFMAKCQKDDIYAQYIKHGVRCFDLRIRFDNNGNLILCHGSVEYELSYYHLIGHLEWFQLRKDVTVRLLLDLRGVPSNTWDFQRKKFYDFYMEVLKPFNNITYILGRDLPEWKKCIITLPEGDVEENYSSVKSPKYIDDWWPWLYARLHNHKILEKGTDKEILLIDFVNIK